MEAGNNLALRLDLHQVRIINLSYIPIKHFEHFTLGFNRIHLRALTYGKEKGFDSSLSSLRRLYAIGNLRGDRAPLLDSTSGCCFLPLQVATLSGSPSSSPTVRVCSVSFRPGTPFLGCGCYCTIAVRFDGGFGAFACAVPN